jgi:CRISPR-associated protein Cas1
VDLSVIQAFESGALELHDFYFTGDDYRYRFEAEAKQRFIELLREQLNSGVNYRGRVLKWDTVIEQKAVELGRFLVGRSQEVEFVEPTPILKKLDSLKLHKRILSMSAYEASKLGIGKDTLHYLRRNAKDYRLFKVYTKVREKLETLPLTQESMSGSI